MTEPLRALVVIFALAVITFSFTSKAFANSIDIRALKEWRNTWLVITFAAFLSHSFWLYATIAIIVLIVASRRTKNPVALLIPPATLTGHLRRLTERSPTQQHIVSLPQLRCMV